MLLERAVELGLLQSAIADVRGGSGRIVIIEGPAGIGKSALLGQARAAASQAGLQVLSARGNELEREFAFGVARQLFEVPVARADAERQEQLLAGAAGFTRPLLGLERRHDDRADPQPEATSRPAPDIGFTLSHGLYWLTANLADREPLMVSVDDAQFADRSTLQCLVYLAARCHELPVLLAVTIRSDEASAADELLQALRGTDDATIIAPAALSQEGVAVLVRDRLGAEAVSEFCDACARATGGNPFLLGSSSPICWRASCRRQPPTPSSSTRSARSRSGASFWRGWSDSVPRPSRWPRRSQCSSTPACERPRHWRGLDPPPPLRRPTRCCPPGS